MKTLQTIENPIWQDAQTKDRIIARFVYDDGTSSVVSFPVDETNPDYIEFSMLSSIDDTETNTQKIRDEQVANREKAIAQRAEAADQKRSNNLFNAKIEAFESSIVQAASKEWKAKIRKATTMTEVIAIVAALMIMGQDGTNAVDDPAE